MPDRLFSRSVGATAAIVSVLLAGFVLFLCWTGWAGVVAVLAVLSAFLWWFYFGHRPDLEGKGNPKSEGPEDGRA